MLIYDSLDPEQPSSPAENCAGLLRRLLFARIVKQSLTAQTSSSIIATFRSQGNFFCCTSLKKIPRNQNVGIIDDEVCAVKDCLTILANSNRGNSHYSVDYGGILNNTVTRLKSYTQYLL